MKHRIDKIDQHSAATKKPAAGANVLQERRPTKDQLPPLPTALLLPFDPTQSFLASIPFAFEDYLELVDTVGRAVHPGKRGTIPETTPAILKRLGINLATFIEHSDQFLKRFGNNVGTPAKLIDLALPITHK